MSLGRPPRKTRPETVVCLDSWGRLHDANCKFPKCSPDQDPVNHARKINFLSLFGNAIIRRLENAQPFRYLCNILKKFQNFEEVSKRLSFFAKIHDKKRLEARPTMLDSLSRLSAQIAVGPALQQARHLVLPFAPQPVLLEGFVIHLGRAQPNAPGPLAGQGRARAGPGVRDL